MAQCCPDRIAKPENFVRGIPIIESGLLPHSVIDDLTALHRGLTGIHALVKAQDAFAARLAIIEAAQDSLAFQYYIWRRDVAGTILFDAVRRAADRGVRVRLLLDDLHTSGLDATLRALSDHNLIEVRLFNVFRLRRLRIANLLFSFQRLNRRMHNKTMIADQRIVIVGGRNIGDDYFFARDGTLFSDLDVLAIGAVVDEAIQLFDEFWNGSLAVSAERVLPEVGTKQTQALAADAHRVISSDRASLYMQSIRRIEIIEDIAQSTFDFHWAPAHILGDDPNKTSRVTANMSQNLTSLFGHPQRELFLLSAYFVPTHTLRQILQDCAIRGVDVHVLTNAFEATDRGSLPTCRKI